MKELIIGKSDGKYLIEINSEMFIHSTKRSFDTEEQFLEYLGELKPIISDYKLSVSEELWALVVNFLSKQN